MGLRCGDFADPRLAGCDPAVLLQGGAARELLGVEEASPEARHEGWLWMVVVCLVYCGWGSWA